MKCSGKQHSNAQRNSGEDHGQKSVASKQALLKNEVPLSLQRLAKAENEGGLLKRQECGEMLTFSCTAVEMQIVSGLLCFIIMPCSA